MIFKKKEDLSVEERLKEIEKKIKGETKPENIEVPKTEIKKEVETKEEVSVPLFIKLDKYKNIVSALMQLKTYTIALKNSLVALEHIEKAREETISVLSKNLEKMNEKISELEKDLVKPIGFPYAPPETFEELSTLQTSLTSLKSQIEQLKEEIEKS